MRILNLLLLFLAACAANTPVDVDREVSLRHAPPARAPVEPTPEVVAALTAGISTAIPRTPNVSSSDAPLAELPAQVLADSEISVTVVGHYGAAQCRDKSWLVHAGPNTRVIAYASTHGAAGAALNLRGSNQFDVLPMRVELPLRVEPEDALVVVSGSPPGSFSTTDEAMGVVFVRFPVHPELFHGPLIGDGFLPRYFRSFPIAESHVDMNRAPAVIDMRRIYKPAGPIDATAWGSAMPTVSGLLEEIGRCSGEVVDGWPVASFAPTKQHRGYGTFFSGQVSTALCVLLSTYPVEERRQLACALVQRGLDQIGATCDGRVLYPNGGHCQGRKALVILTGHLLHVDEFCQVSRYFPDVFQEDLCYPAQRWWFGAGWTVGWVFSSRTDGRQLASPPSTWGVRDAPNHDTWNWLFGYYGQAVPSQVGSALAMVLIDREREMGRMVQAVRQFMAGPPAEADSALRAAGHTMPWGKDYATPTGFCSTAWKLYGH